MWYHRACDGVLMNKQVIIDKIKLNRRYVNNEDLLDQFVNTTIERIGNLLKDIKDEKLKQKLLDKTISKVILDVLMNNNRCNSGFIKKQKIDYKQFNTISGEGKCSKPSLGKLKQLYSTLKKSDENNNTNYLKILNSMYRENKTLREMSDLMNISENDIVDILFDMSEYSGKVMQV